MKRECCGNEWGVFKTWDRKWWFALTVNVVNVEDQEERSGGEVRSMSQHMSPVRK
jgi:hypothetical protein